MSHKPILGLTMGDPAGIGPEICGRALREPSVLAVCVPVLFGDTSVLDQPGRRGFPAPGARVVSLAEFDASGALTAPLIVDCAMVNAEEIQAGLISAACGQAAFRSRARGALPPPNRE